MHRTHLLGPDSLYNCGRPLTRYHHGLVGPNLVAMNNLIKLLTIITTKPHNMLCTGTHITVNSYRFIWIMIILSTQQLYYYTAIGLT